jgi:hypothetical protein
LARTGARYTSLQITLWGFFSFPAYLCVTFGWSLGFFSTRMVRELT